MNLEPGRILDVWGVYCVADPVGSCSSFDSYPLVVVAAVAAAMAAAVVAVAAVVLAVVAPVFKSFFGGSGL